jgi:hypothetical protein
MGLKDTTVLYLKPTARLAREPLAWRCPGTAQERMRLCRKGFDRVLPIGRMLKNPTMTTEELAEFISKHGLQAIRVHLSENESSAPTRFAGTLDGYFEALKTLGAQVVFVAAMTLDEEDFQRRVESEDVPQSDGDGPQALRTPCRAIVQFHRPQSGVAQQPDRLRLF